MVISSALLKPSARAPYTLITSTIASSPHDTTAICRIDIASIFCHIPSATASLKATYTTSRIEVRSVLLMIFLLRSTHLPISGRERCPTTNGSISCNKIDRIAPRVSSSCAPCVSIIKPIITGDKNTPRILEADALQIAAATFPPATEVKAIADCTVAGKAHKYKKPM